MKGSRFSEEQIIGCCGGTRREPRPRRSAAPRDLQRDLLQVEIQVRRSRGVRGAPPESSGRREPPA
jgi:hypothetical protein